MYFLLLVIPIQYKTSHCKSTNKNSVCNNRYHTYHNSLENLNKFIHKFTKTFYNVEKWSKVKLLYKVSFLSFLFRIISVKQHTPFKSTVMLLLHASLHLLSEIMFILNWRCKNKWRKLNSVSGEKNSICDVSLAVSSQMKFTESFQLIFTSDKSIQMF